MLGITTLNMTQNSFDFLVIIFVEYQMVVCLFLLIYCLSEL